MAAILIAFWAIALVCWWASLWHADAFARMGIPLPLPTRLVQAGAELGVPFALAALFSGSAAAHLAWRRDRALRVAVWLLLVALALALCVVVAITAPMLRLCGEFVPQRSQPAAAALADRSGGGRDPASHGCTR